MPATFARPPVAGTAGIATDSELTAAVAAHQADTANIHGIPDTTALTTTAAVNAGYMNALKPQAYGAVGDGVTDDTTAVQAALNAVPATGGLVYLPAGTYKVSAPLLVKSATVLSGAGMGATTVKLAAGSYTGIPKSSILLNAAYASYGWGGNVMVDSDIHVRDMTIDGNRANITPGTESEGIDWIGVTGFTIRQVELVNVAHDAIDLDASQYGTIEGCIIDNAGWNGLHAGWTATNSCKFITITGCVVTGCAQDRQTFGDGFNAGIHNDAENAIVSRNTVTGCWQGILVSSTSGGGALVTGNYVGTTLTDYGIAFYSSYGRLTDNYVVPGSGATAPVYLGGAAYMVCSGNTVSHGTYGIRCLASKPAVVTGNVIRGALIQYAVELQSAAHTVSGNTIENYPSHASRGAIHAASSAAGAVITCNRVDAATGTGRGVLSAANGVTVEGNSFNGTPAAYIEVTAADNIVSGNNGRAATTAGLVLSAGSSYAMVSGNVFRGSTAGGTNAGTGNVFGTNSPTIS